MPEVISDADPRNSPDANGRRFNGYIFTFGDGDIVKGVNRVQAKYNESELNRTTLTNGIDYVFSGKKIELQSNFVFRIFVDFDLEITQQQFESKAPKEFVDLQQQLAGTIGKDMKASAANFKAEDFALNGSPFNIPGETINGMKGVFGGSKPIKDGIKKLRPAVMQLGAGDGSADKTSTQLSNIQTLTGKLGMSTTNLNKIVISQGSPAGSLKIFKKHLTANATKVREFASSTRSSALSTKVVSRLQNAVDNEDVGISPSNNAVKKVITEVKSKLPKINNAGLSLGGLINKVMPSGGRSGMNVLPNLLSKSRGGLTNLLGDIKKTVAGVAPDLQIPEGFDVPNLIEGIDTKTGELSLNSNFSKLVDKGDLISKEIVPIEIQNLQTSQSGFSGFSTSPNYKFEIVDSMEELQQELENSERAKADNPNSITTLVIGWTAKYAGPPPPTGNFDAAFIHEKSKKADQAFLVAEKSSAGSDPSDVAKDVNSELSRNAALFGIQSHYIIRTDGTIQRGRPIDEIRNTKYATFTKSGVQLTLVATKEKPATQFQIASLEEFMKVFYEVFPGANVYGDYEINRRYEGPGFDIDIYRKKFEKTTNIDDPTTVTEGPSKKASAFIRPKNVAKSTTTAFNSKRKFSFDAVLKDFEKINELDGEKITKDIDTATSEINTALSDSKSIEKGIQNGFNAAKNEAAGSFAKLKGDLQIKDLTVRKDALNGQIDSVIQEAAPSTSTAAQKLTDGITAFTKLFK
tara:strand:- start:3344 stop:5584 length:2241 start_codon:yes stop_codon:yes gene_type:complete